MNMIDSIKEEFDRLQSTGGTEELTAIRKKAFDAFTRMGIPTVRNEDWKYTRISGLFNKEYHIGSQDCSASAIAGLDALRLPGHEQASELFFVNGVFSAALSTIRSEYLKVMSLEAAAGNEYKEIFARHFDHSSRYNKDGINALNTAFLHGGVFIHVPAGKVEEHPIYIYNITDAAFQPVFSQPRSLLYIGARAAVQIVETYATLGASESFTNQVMEMVVEEAANVSYYKIQNDAANASQVSTLHIRQTGKACVNAVTISLDGGIVRNNLNMVMEAANAEAHLYGLYLVKGRTHISNYTVVDNVAPGCQSNELYRGVLDDESTGVFNGKIFVRPDAQKTNAFQSNKNILLSEAAGVNTKPQLEIFADDVKCSHGCTVGRLDEEGLFYLQSRGIPEKKAVSLLLQGFVSDVVEKIALQPIREYVNRLIAQRLETDKEL